MIHCRANFYVSLSNCAYKGEVRPGERRHLVKVCRTVGEKGLAAAVVAVVVVKGDEGEGYQVDEGLPTSEQVKRRKMRWKEALVWCCYAFRGAYH